MLKLAGNAKLMALTPGIQFHGEEHYKSVTLTLKFPSVPLDVVEDGFIGQLSLVYGDGEEYQLPELEQLIVSREVENVRVEVAGEIMPGMRVDQVRLKLLPRRTAEVTLKVKGRFEEDLNPLHEALLETTPVVLTEFAPPPELDHARGGQLSLVRNGGGES